VGGVEVAAGGKESVGGIDVVLVEFGRRRDESRGVPAVEPANAAPGFLGGPLPAAVCLVERCLDLFDDGVVGVAER